MFARNVIAFYYTFEDMFVCIIPCLYILDGEAYDDKMALEKLKEGK